MGMGMGCRRGGRKGKETGRRRRGERKVVGKVKLSSHGKKFEGIIIKWVRQNNGRKISCVFFFLRNIRYDMIMCPLV